MLNSALYNVIIGAVQKALRPLGRDFREIEKLQITKKGVSDFVTSADIRTEQILVDALKEARPKFGFITEETGVIDGKDKDHIWIIDPIDGTTNFMHGIPHFAIAVALQYKSEVIAALTFNPITGEEFYAEKGKGSYLNGHRIRISSRIDMESSLFATGLPFKGCEGLPLALKETEAFLNETAGIRRCGSAALDLAYVACGRFEGYWERNLHIWDIAGGILLVTEAGGKVTSLVKDADPMQNGHIIASNKLLHAHMEHILSAQEA
ncbi:MAG: myo-inositol-1(or 4)-monophosphatase [Alphaproteobacteria bacterium]|jgi:myo-inositol-1(or 4)-monophosphatase